MIQGYSKNIDTKEKNIIRSLQSEKFNIGHQHYHMGLFSFEK
jgi:hypothetical protein